MHSLTIQHTPSHITTHPSILLHTFSHSYTLFNTLQHFHARTHTLPAAAVRSSHASSGRLLTNKPAQKSLVAADTGPGISEDTSSAVYRAMHYDANLCNASTTTHSDRKKKKKFQYPKVIGFYLVNKFTFVFVKKYDMNCWFRTHETGTVQI